MAATVFKYLSYLGLIVGLVLSFSVLRWGALCFLFSVACAHLAGSARAEKHASDMQESLFIVLTLLSQMKEKLERESTVPGGNDNAERTAESRKLRPVQNLRE